MLLLNALLLATLSTAASLTRFAREPDFGRTLETRQTGPRYPAHTIDQPIDHFPHKKRYEPHTNATFKQRYFFDSSYYKPGGPVFLYIGGETSGESRFSNLQTGIIQVLMQQFNGLGVILENRYYGKSYPFSDSSTDHLAYLSTEQTIADNAYFARNAVFDGVTGNLTAPGTPWILYGGSLAGAQTAFSLKAHGDVLYGGIASSGTIHAQLEYPEWYNPIQKWAPGDCTSRINRIVDGFDGLLAAKNESAISHFKSLFGLCSLTDNRDFAMTVAFPLGGPMNYPTNTWQELNWNPTYGSDDFWNFCRNVSSVPGHGYEDSWTKVDKDMKAMTGRDWTGLGGYAAYFKQVVLPLCPPESDINSTQCFGTQNETYWADTANSAGRSYLYTTCTESGGYQVAQPHGPSLVSRVLQINYTQQWCNWAFAPGSGKYNSIPKSPDLSLWNKYGDYNVTADRLAFIDGANDVWLDLCYHSSNNKAPIRYSSDLHPEYLIAGAGHHWDSYSYGFKNISLEPQFIREAHYWEIRTVQRWLDNFSAWKPSRPTRDEL